MQTAASGTNSNVNRMEKASGLLASTRVTSTAPSSIMKRDGGAKKLLPTAASTAVRTEYIGAETINIEGDIAITSHVEAEKEILCVKYTPNHELLAAGLTDGRICLFNFSTGKCESTLSDSTTIANPIPVTCIKHRPYRKNTAMVTTIIATYVDGCVKCWHYNEGACLYTIQENRQTLGLAYHHHLPKFITVGDDTKVYLYDEETKTQERMYQASDAPEDMDGHVSRVFSACFNPRSHHEFVTGGWDDTLQFWDVRQPYSVRHIYGVHMCGDGIDVASTGKEILTSAWQRVTPLQLWDYGSGKLIQNIEPDPYESMLYCGKHISKELLACGGSDVNLIRIIDQRNMTTMAVVRGFNSGVYSLDSGPSRSKRSKQKGMKIASKLASSHSTVSHGPNAEQIHLPRVAFCAGCKVYEFDFK